MTNDLVSGQNYSRTYIPDAYRKPQKTNTTEGVLKLQNSETFILCRVLPTLLFIREQAVTNTLPAVSSVRSGLQFLRSVRHQCGKSPSSEVRGSASGAGLSSSAFSITSFSTPLLALLLTQRALWHHQCKN